MKFLNFSYLLSFTKAISTKIIKKCAINCHNSYIFQPFPETMRILQEILQNAGCLNVIKQPMKICI